MLDVELTDCFDLDKDRVFITGTQALVRLCLMQQARDQRAGLRTAGYVTGYRGSPLGALDQQFPRAAQQLEAANIVFHPALNEDLAATALWGSQQAELRGEGRFDGVFGLWYGKGPGVDRSGDVFRHGNLAGTSRYGGVVVVTGDDHTCESSTTCHQSEFALVDAMIPVLNPANLEEILQYGLHAWAVSRFAGVWCALKAVKDNVESTGSIDAAVHRFQTRIPVEYALPTGGLNIRVADSPQAQELRLHRHKLDAVRAYARLNRIDNVVFGGGAEARIGIVCTGKSYLDTVQALEELGIDSATAARLGVRVYKVGMSWPLEPQGLVEFVDGLELVIVVEEKRGLIEEQIRSQLYGRADAPRIIGKRDERGERLFQSDGALNPVQIAAVIGQRLLERHHDERLAGYTAQLTQRLNQESAALLLQRKPYFCAGCPHNSSTVIPDGSRAYAGIGCHWMVQFMDRHTEGYTHMGGEGANWIGEAPFSTRRHIIQNMGDGTFNHSGIMAIRAAVAAAVPMTFKLLYNDAVAMTGGQAHDGGSTVYRMAAEIASLGVRRVALVSDRPELIDRSLLPAGVSVDHRDQSLRVQQELAELPAVTVLIHEQTCAAEKRRRRKRGLFPDPPRRLYINERVCEGCGDCGVQSNCVALLPQATEFGRKRRIDQSACNKDFSCVRGFCPSFVEIEGGALRRPKVNAAPMPEPPEPAQKATLQHPYAIVLTGVGGTGVVTVAALLGMAAHLEGRGCGVIDMAGLAQKGGAVVSHVRLAASPASIRAIRVAPGGADLVLGCDLLVTASDPVLRTMRQDRSRAVVNTFETMPGDFTREPDLEFPSVQLRARLRNAVGDNALVLVDATQVAAQLLGDSIGANLFLLGVAYQRGYLPLGVDAIHRAIELNGVAVEFNQRAFAWGRQWVSDPQQVARHRSPATTVALPGPSVKALIERQQAMLTQYHSASYAARYRSLLDRVLAADPDRRQELTRAVAVAASKLMAFKDEYEVARLYTEPAFREQLAAEFDGDYTVSVYLAPPWLSRTDPLTGRPVKRRFGPWVFRLMALLARLRRVRGTVFDVFGYTAERRMERGLVEEYFRRIDALLHELEQWDYAAAVELARLPEQIRGFGPVKLASVARYREQLATLESNLLTRDARETQIA